MSGATERSREGIQDTTRETRAEIKRRLEGTGVLKDDKEVVCETAREIDAGGLTSEGITEVERCLEHGVQEIRSEFDREEHKLEREVLDRARQHEAELSRSLEVLRENQDRLKNALSRLETIRGRGTVEGVERVTKDEQEFTDGEKRAQEDDRTKGEQELRDQKAAMGKGNVRLRR